VTWNNINIAALNRMRHLLSPSSLTTLDQFARARTAPSPENLWLLWKAGVYRQSCFENAGMFFGALFRRI
jgi:hypothetical protein